MAHSYTQELEELIKSELLPVYFKYFRLLNVTNTLSKGQQELVKDLYNDPKLCKLVQKSDIAQNPQE